MSTTHDYTTVDGTEPTDLSEHEPRTIEHRADEQHVSMMTEIGDGTFVNWTTCRRCQKQVATCACAGGPQEPDYITRWRGARWIASFDDRPDLDLKVIDSLITQLRARGYAVRKPGEKASPRDTLDLSTLITETQAAQNAASGDSNDEEIDLLRSALEMALNALGLDLPESVDPDDEDEPADPQEVAAETEKVADETWDRTCDRHGGAWGTDETCPRCVAEDGSVLATEDDVDFARETLGEEAPADEVQDLAEQRADNDAKEVQHERQLDDISVDF